MASTRAKSRRLKVDGQRGVVNRGSPAPGVQAPQRAGVGPSGVDADRGVGELPGGRRADETPKSYAAFLAYVALGARRSVREAAHQNHIKTTSTWKISSVEDTTVRTWLGWSARHKWVSRSLARDEWIARTSDDQIVSNVTACKLALTSGRPRRRHRGARDGAQWPGRARVRTDGARRVHHGSHAGRELENRPHGRALLGGRDRRTRGRRTVFVKAGTGGRHDSTTASLEPHFGMNSRCRVNGSRTLEPRQHHSTQEHGPSKASRGSLRSSGAPRLGSRASLLAWRPARPTDPQSAPRHPPRAASAGRAR